MPPWALEGAVQNSLDAGMRYDWTNTDFHPDYAPMKATPDQRRTVYRLIAVPIGVICVLAFVAALSA